VAQRDILSDSEDEADGIHRHEETVFSLRDLEDLYSQMATEDQRVKDFVEKLVECFQTMSF
jgi:hypothetical protein